MWTEHADLSQFSAHFIARRTINLLSGLVNFVLVLKEKNRPEAVIKSLIYLSARNVRYRIFVDINILILRTNLDDTNSSDFPIIQYSSIII